MDSDVSFSRVSRTGDELAELRLNAPRHVLAVIDSVAISESRSSGKFTSRTDIVNRLLLEFVEHKIEEANLINKAIKDYPTVVEGNSND